MAETAAATVRQVFGVRVVYDELAVAVQEVKELPTYEEKKEELLSKIRDKLDELLSEERVQFRPGSAEILPESFPLLDRIVETLNMDTDSSVEISGHTDNLGDDLLNLDLSLRRAEVVRAYIVAHGIKSERLKATGYGEAYPIADNGTIEGRKINRRVEFKVTENKEDR